MVNLTVVDTNVTIGLIEYTVSVLVQNEPINVTIENTVMPISVARAITLNFSEGYSYVHEQSISSTLWEIHHGMNRFPSVTIVDSAGDSTMTDVDYVSGNQINLTFNAAVSGYAYLN